MKSLVELQEEEYEHIRSLGSYFFLCTDDSVHNDRNHEIIQAFAREHDETWLGKINFGGKKCGEIKNGICSPLTQYMGESTYNSCCDFCVPCKDEMLEQLIKTWNTTSNIKLLDLIIDRIKFLHGVYFIWI